MMPVGKRRDTMFRFVFCRPFPADAKRRERLLCEHLREASPGLGGADLDRRGRRSQRRS